MAIMLGLSSAFMFGLLDILITLATRTIGIRYTQVLSHATAAGILFLFLSAHTSSLTLGLPFASIPLLLCIGSGLGLVDGLTNLSLYRALSLGPLALISPVTASYGLITMGLAVLLLHKVPSLLMSVFLLLVVGGMILIISTGEKSPVSLPNMHLSHQSLAFIALALALSFLAAGTLFAMLLWLELTTWLVLFSSLVEGICMLLACCLAIAPFLSSLHHWWTNLQHQSGLIFGIGAMLGFGMEYFLLSLATAHLGPVHPVVISRLCSALFLFAYARHQQVEGWGEIQLKHLALIALIGLLDVLGTISYDIGSRQNTVLVAALSSLYPLFPFGIGVVWYRESVKPPQWAGVGIMVLSMVGLSLFGK